jgi:hypothetical protein
MLKSTLPPAGELHLNALVDELGKVESSFLASRLIKDRKKKRKGYPSITRRQTGQNPQIIPQTQGGFGAHHLSLRKQTNPPPGSSYRSLEAANRRKICAESRPRNRGSRRSFSNSTARRSTLSYVGFTHVRGPVGPSLSLKRLVHGLYAYPLKQRIFVSFTPFVCTRKQGVPWKPRCTWPPLPV